MRRIFSLAEKLLAFQAGLLCVELSYEILFLTLTGPIIAQLVWWVGCGLDYLGLNFWHRQEILLFARTFRLILGPLSLPFSGCWDFFFLWVKWPCWPFTSIQCWGYHGIANCEFIFRLFIWLTSFITKQYLGYGISLLVLGGGGQASFIFDS